MTRTKARRGKCGHTGATFLDRYSDTVRGCHVFHKRCLRCMEQIGIGPANSSGSRVRLEIEAARIAADSVDDWPAFGNGIGVEIGWEEHQIGSTNHLTTFKRKAGYLARCIATHKDESP